MSSRVCVPALVVLSCLICSGPRAHADKPKVDKQLPAFKVTSGREGMHESLKVGPPASSHPLLAQWIDALHKHMPMLGLEVAGQAAPAASLANLDRYSFDLAERPATEEERTAFQEKFGYQPTQLRAAMDLVAVVVHKDNPIRKLGLEQLDAVFSATRNGGAKTDVTTWGDLGLRGEWAERPITLYGHNASAALYDYVQDKVLLGGSFKDAVQEQPAGSAIVAKVAGDLGAIGYASAGYLTDAVRAVSLSSAKGKSATPPTQKKAKRYPLVRYLWLSTAYEPRSDLDAVRTNVLRFIYSREGQEVVVQRGLLPLPAKVAKAELRKVGL